MKKITILLILLSVALFAATNLLPPPGEEWGTPGRNADGISSFGIEELDGKPAFHIIMRTQQGYTHYRQEMRLQPGEYTISCLAKGNTRNGLNIEIYSFNEAGKPHLICNYLSPAGTIAETTLMHTYFKVPGDSVRVRIGFGISGQGEGFFAEPTLLAGKVPPAADAPVAPKLSAAQEKWLASWIFLKNDPGEPRMTFTKRFVLDAEVSDAYLQLTADNGYEIIVNGKTIGSDVDWQNTEVYNIMPLLKKGENTFTVNLMNYDGLGGLLLQSVIHDMTGKEIVITSDDTWELTLPEGRKGELEVIGKVPVVPWANVHYHKILPPKRMDLEMLECENTTEAGGMLHYVFAATNELLDKKNAKLAFKFTDETGRETPLSAFDDFVRIVPEEKKLFIDVATSAYAMPGTYHAEVIGEGYVIPAGQVTITPSSAPKKCGYKLPKPSNSNTFTTENFSQSLFTYSFNSPLGESHYRSWADTNGHMYEFGVAASHWNSKNRFNTVEAEQILLRILENDPYAGVVFKFRIDVPGWWVAKHPNDVFVSNNNRSAQQSFCSDAWREDAIDAVCGTIEELAKRPSGQAIVGVLLMGYRGGEFQLWGEDVGEYDCSPVAQAEFRKFLDRKHVQEEIKLPHPALKFPLGPTDKHGEAVRDLFFRFVAERQGDNMAYFVREFRKRMGDRYAIGMYYGYGLEYAGSNNRMLLAGHLGLEHFWAQETPDLASCPFSYSYRPFNRSHAYMYPVDSARLHGILPIGENDIRNCMNPEVSDSSGRTIFSMTDSIEDNLRIRLFAAAHGSLVRYLALHPIVDWFYHPVIVRSIRQDNDLVMTLEANPVGGTDEQVVLVANYLEWTKGWRLPDKTFYTFAGQARDTIMRTGRTVSFVTFEDYATRVKSWKNALIPVPGLMTEEQKATLEAAYGKLPPIKLTDGALILRDGKWSVLDATATANDIWKALATNEALEAGFDTVWYIGANYKYSWDGKRLHKK